MRAGSPLAALRDVPVTVVGGYLGSGKTTLINGWLRDTPRPDWAVLVNDLGALAIDADRLRSHHGRVLELSGGCLCCSLRDGLGDALLALARLPRPPAHVVIETSGMAIPERIAARQRQWLRSQLEGRPGGAAPATADDPRLARGDHWLQERPLSREALGRWAAALGPEVLRLKGEVWLREHPEGPAGAGGGAQRPLAVVPAAAGALGGDQPRRSGAPPLAPRGRAMTSKGGTLTIAYLGVLASLQVVDPTVANTALVEASRALRSARDLMRAIQEAYASGLGGTMLVTALLVGLLLIISLLLLVIGGLQPTPPGQEIGIAGKK